MEPFVPFQDLTFETRSLDHLERMLALALELTGHHALFRTDQAGRATYYPSWAASLSFTRSRPPAERPAHYRQLCVIAASEDRSGPSTRIPTSTPAELLAQTMAIARGADRAAFQALTGEGPFAGGDGVTSIGWRLHGGSALHPPLVLSLCHIYHPK